MIRFRLLIPLIALWFLVPWWFSGASSAGFWGIPVWAWYAIAMTGAYAVLIAWMLERYWDEEADNLDKDSSISDVESENPPTSQEQEKEASE